MATYTRYSKDDFIALIAPIVLQVHREGGRLFPSVRIAQSWLETGGNVPYWNNLGGYKVGSGEPTPYWDGSSVSTATKEVVRGVTVNTQANWRAYPSIYNFYKDQDLLFDKSRYAAVRAARTPQQQCRALQDCGYATDPAYASKLIAVIAADGLTRYDSGGAAEEEEDRPMTAAEKQAFEALQAKVAALEAKHSMTVPAWAKDAVDAAVKARLIDTPNGRSEDFYALLTVLHRKGLF